MRVISVMRSVSLGDTPLLTSILFPDPQYSSFHQLQFCIPSSLSTFENVADSFFWSGQDVGKFPVFIAAVAGSVYSGPGLPALHRDRDTPTHPCLGLAFGWMNFIGMVTQTRSNSC
jgi:hypothetical protein